MSFINHIQDNVTKPVVASSSAEKLEHFSEVFEKTKAEASLDERILHMEEVPIEKMKEHMRQKGLKGPFFYLF